MWQKFGLLASLLVIAVLSGCAGEADINQDPNKDILIISVARTSVGPPFVADVVKQRNTKEGWQQLKMNVYSTITPLGSWARPENCSNYNTPNTLFKDCIFPVSWDDYNYGHNPDLGRIIIHYAMMYSDDFRIAVAGANGQYDNDVEWDNEVKQLFWQAIEGSSLLYDANLCPQGRGENPTCSGHPRHVERPIVMLYVNGGTETELVWLGECLIRKHYIHLVNAAAIDYYVENAEFGGEGWATRCHPEITSYSDKRKWLCQHVELHEFAHSHLRITIDCSYDGVSCALVRLLDATTGRKASAWKLCHQHYSKLRDNLRFLEDVTMYGCQ